MFNRGPVGCGALVHEREDECDATVVQIVNFLVDEKVGLAALKPLPSLQW